MISIFAGMAVALYAAHHVGDYWVQTDHQARHKGLPGREGARACLLHVYTYLATQVFFVMIVAVVTGVRVTWLGLGSAVVVSGVTHYLADRREYGLMFKLARMLPGKAAFLKLGVPRQGARYLEDPEHTSEPMHATYDDNPSLGTGAWALDQSWHIFWGVFVAALLIAAL